MGRREEGQVVRRCVEGKGGRKGWERKGESKGRGVRMRRGGKERGWVGGRG